MDIWKRLTARFSPRMDMFDFAPDAKPSPDERLVAFADKYRVPTEYRVVRLVLGTWYLYSALVQLSGTSFRDLSTGMRAGRRFRLGLHELCLSWWTNTSTVGVR